MTHMLWPLPPDLPWPAFLRRLRHPAPPPGWLEAAAGLEDVQRRPLLLRWIVQHPKAPAHLRARFLPRLPWRALAQITWDASAHPQARAIASDRLQILWTGLSLGERRSLAARAPRPLWRLVWKVPDARLLKAFLLHPWLNVDHVTGLLQAPLLGAQAEALAASPWAEQEGVAIRLLQVLDESLRLPEPQVVLGHGAPWIRALPPDQRLVVSTTLRHPALRRMVRSHAAGALRDAGLP